MMNGVTAPVGTQHLTQLMTITGNIIARLPTTNMAARVSYPSSDSHSLQHLALHSP